MKRSRLPLTALRSFEAAGRHGSFGKAAEELFVSQAAISRQIRELEALIGRPLFERQHRKVVLTEAGAQLLARLTGSFDAIERALDAAAAAPARYLVKVSVEPGFAGLWLVPHLADFNRLHPDIDVSVEVDARVIEFRGDEPRLAIRFSATKDGWPRTESLELTRIRVTPVLSPDLLASGPPLDGPADLLAHTLLHDESRDFWGRWLEAAGMRGALPQRGPIFTDSALAVQAARLGHGVALGDLALIADDLESGRLVSPFAQALDYGAYWLVTPKGGTADPATEAFCTWLVNAFAGDAG